MNKNQIAVQDYNLVNSKYKLNPAEIKFVLLAISKIDSVNASNFKEEYIIPIPEITTAFQTKQNHVQLKTFAKKLMSKPLEIELNNGNWAIFNFFSKVEYIGGAFKVRIDGDLKPYLLELQKNFVQTDLKYIMHMTSQYAVRLYQLLKQYQKIGGRDFILAELQDTLQVPKSYTKKYNDFKEKVLEIAVKQINEFTDLKVKYDVKKVSRKVNEICFSIKTKAKSEIQTSQLFQVEVTELPKIVSLVKGIYGFKNCDNFYTPFADGSFNLEKEDGTKMHFKSEKQLEFFAKNPDKF
jgi:plasmid replication initiation protein